MTLHVLIVVALALALVALVRWRLIQVDLFFPWFVAVVVLGFVATRPALVDRLVDMLGILYPPIAVIFLAVFLLVGIVVTLTVFVTRLRSRLAALIEHVALAELDKQEWAIAQRASDTARDHRG